MPRFQTLRVEEQKVMKTRKHVAVSRNTSARLKSRLSTFPVMDRGREVFAKLSNRVTGGV